jgi:hypothetical protein
MTAAATPTEAMNDNGDTTVAATTTEATNDDGNTMAAATPTEAMNDNGDTTAAATQMEAMTPEDDNDDHDNDSDTAATTTGEMPAPISIDQPESAATEVEEAREHLLLDAAKTLIWQGNRGLFIRRMLQKLYATQPMANHTPSEGIHLW